MTKRRLVSERRLLRDFARILSKNHSRGVVLGVGDDTSVLRPPARRDLLITTDAQVEGRHFQRSWLTGRELGWRLAAVNLSDIAAMGGEPLHGVVSLAVPRNLGAKYITGIERGVRDQLARYGATIVGGNLSGSDAVIMCDLTLIGACRRGRAWRRTCRAGRDAIIVVGRLGEARAGIDILKSGGRGNPPAQLVRAYKRPTPRLDAARLLQPEHGIHGAIDVSDGFGADLIKLCEASDAGCEVDETALPISSALRSFCARRGKTPVEYAIEGGEDYALILAVSAVRADAVISRLRTHRIPAAIVGRFTKLPGRYRLSVAGRRPRSLPRRGWDHLARG